jgi:ABC-type transport system involved in multi-copper enzyme maturation permease subunit
MVNGQELDAAKIVIMVSKITFHMISLGVMFLAALLAMRIFRRDRDDGTQSCILSKPITRWQYVTGKIIGLWILLISFMFILHGIIFMITSIKMNIVMPEYLIASLLCSFNLLFIIVAVLLLSLMMPDIAAFLCVVGIGIIGLVADGVSAMSHSPMGQAMMQSHAQPDLSFWKIISILWPKLSDAQYFASSFIGSEGMEIGSVYPLINILIYCLMLGALLFWRFRNEDIA